MPKEVTRDEFLTELNGADASRLIVVDFFATWCGPCNMISPFVVQLSQQYPSVSFLKCNVDKANDLAHDYNVSAMPTFIFFKNRQEIDRIRGADKKELENKVRQYSGSGSTPAAATTSGASANEAAQVQNANGGYIDLNQFINKPQCECLNEDDDHTWTNVLNNSTLNYLKSDCDEQLILFLTFTQTVKINSLIVQGPKDNGPKKLKLFINQTRTLDFDSAERAEPMQEFDLKPEDLENNQVLNLRFVKFQNVQSITLFFANNQSGSDSTVVHYLKFLGAPVSVTNMNEFKRVSGQAGEAHG